MFKLIFKRIALTMHILAVFILLTQHEAHSQTMSKLKNGKLKEYNQPVLSQITTLVLEDLSLSSQELLKKDSESKAQYVGRKTLLALKSILDEACEQKKKSGGKFDPELAIYLNSGCSMFQILDQLTAERAFLQSSKSPLALPESWTTFHLGAGIWHDDSMKDIPTYDNAAIAFQHILSQLMFEKSLDGVYDYLSSTAPLTSTVEFRTSVYPWLRMKLLSISRTDALLNIYDSLKCRFNDKPCLIQKSVQATILKRTISALEKETLTLRDSIGNIGLTSEGSPDPYMGKLQQVYDLNKIARFIRKNASQFNLVELRRLHSLTDSENYPDPIRGYLKILAKTDDNPMAASNEMADILFKLIAFERIVELAERQAQLDAVIEVAPQPWTQHEIQQLDKSGVAEKVVSKLTAESQGLLNEVRYSLQLLDENNPALNEGIQ